MYKVVLAAAFTVPLGVGCGDAPSSSGEGGVGGTPPEAGAGAGAGDAGGGDAGPTLALHDVSVLFPLPTQLDSSDVLRLGSEGRGGPLLSEEIYASLDVFQAQPFSYGDWIVVAARIDPCFPDLALLETAPETCRRQIRLVAQPLELTELASEVAASDQGLHLLYDLGDDFDAAADEWLALRAPGPTDVPLGVHPTLVEEGLDGEFGVAFRAMLTTYVGAATLSQLTFMNGRSVEWEFGGFRVEPAGPLTPIEIHGLEGATRVLYRATSETKPFELEPVSPEGLALLPLAGTYDEDTGSLVFDARYWELKLAVEKAVAIEDPTRENPDTIDCASCHFAERARKRAKVYGVDPGGIPPYQHDDATLFDTVPPAEQENLLQLRGFGWNGTTPIFMQRTIHESAAVATVLGAALPVTSGRGR
jgi:hypothetical protein